MSLELYHPQRPINERGKQYYDSRLMKTGFVAFWVGCIASLVVGCAGDKNDFTPPTYHAQTAQQAAQTYNLHQAINQPPPAQPPSTIQPGPATAESTPPSSVASPVTVAQSPPGVQPDVIPQSPGPDYAWMPSYWTVGVGGSWVWVGGHYVIRRGVSEEQLRAARGMLEQARVGLTDGALKNADKAIDRLNEALRDYRHE